MLDSADIKMYIERVHHHGRFHWTVLLYKEQGVWYRYSG